jgi:hypothetical protein
MDYYYFKAKSLFCGSIVGVNQAPIVKDFAGNGASIERGINPFLLEGKNTLNISAFWPPDKSYQEGLTEVFTEVFLAKKGVDMPTAERILAELSFPNKTNPERYPKSLTIEFDIKNHPNPLLDGLLAKEELTQSDKKDINNVIEKFAKACQNLGTDKIWELGKHKYSAAAIANGISEAVAKTNLDEQMKMLTRHQGVVTLESDFENTIYHPAYNRRIYFVYTLPNMSGTFKLGKEGRTYSARFEVGVGFSNEGWQIVI